MKQPAFPSIAYYAKVRSDTRNDQLLSVYVNKENKLLRIALTYSVSLIAHNRDKSTRVDTLLVSNDHYTIIQEGV